MAKINSKSRLGIILSQLSGFEEQSAALEQYSTESELVADIVWDAGLRGHIIGKVILDAGCGTGLFGIAALLLGAKKVHFVEVSTKAMEIAKKNYDMIRDQFEIGQSNFSEDKIQNFNEKVDTVLQNPPFGTKTKHADREFLVNAFGLSRCVISLHKYSTKGFVEKIAKDNKFLVRILHRINFPIKASMKFHTKKKVYVDVGVWLFEKKIDN